MRYNQHACLDRQQANINSSTSCRIPIHMLDPSVAVRSLALSRRLHTSNRLARFLLNSDHKLNDGCSIFVRRYRLPC